MNNNPAKYKIHDTFVITGRGLVFSGRIIEGNISVGDFIRFSIDDEVRIRKIVGIEGISTAVPIGVNTGLLIECLTPAEIMELRNWNPDQTIGEIYTCSEGESFDLTGSDRNVQ